MSHKADILPQELYKLQNESLQSKQQYLAKAPILPFLKSSWFCVLPKTSYSELWQLESQSLGNICKTFQCLILQVAH